jgi:hypothetical protein
LSQNACSTRETRQALPERHSAHSSFHRLFDPKSVSWTADIVLPDGSLNLYARVHGG